jgi:uncharacterized protein (TIRG00374 family)
MKVKLLKIFNAKILIPIFIFFSLLSVLVFLSSDKQKILEIAAQANATYVLAAVFSTFISYLFLSFNFIAVSALLNFKIGRKTLLLNSFVSSVVTNLLAVPFITGYSTRYIFLKKAGISRGELATYVLIQSQLSNFMPLILLPASLIYLYILNPASLPEHSLGLEILILFLVLLLINCLILFKKTRILVAKALKFLLKRLNYHITDDRIVSLDERVSSALRLLRESPRMLFTSFSFSFLNWVFSLTTLWMCFQAIGTEIKVSILVIGFVLGIIVGVASFIPGGVGVQEVSMSGVYALFGINFQEAILATILYRLIFYIIPFLPAYFIYHTQIKSSK